MEIKIIASTKPGYVAKKEEFDDFSGKVAGVCYMTNDFDSLLNEPKEKTDKRVQSTMSGKHHSVFEHDYITLNLQGVPKLFAMVLNNEKTYVTSEKSARYTKMVCTEEEQKLYDKWYEIFIKKIRQRYPDDQGFMTDLRVKKLAQENARYIISVMTPTTMIYTTSYRQLNYLCNWMQDELNNVNSKYFMLFDYFEKFISFAKSNNLLDERLMNDGKFRKLSLINQGKQRNEIFDDVYSTNYQASFAYLAQAQRHRTLNYEINDINVGEFFVPKILLSDNSLVDEWKTDLYRVKNNLPQGTLVNINERGTYENFVLKLKERLCSCAQLEIDNKTRELLLKYYNATTNEDIKNDIKARLMGSRCTFKDFTCETPCGFADGIKGERDI